MTFMDRCRELSLHYDLELNKVKATLNVLYEGTDIPDRDTPEFHELWNKSDYFQRQRDRLWDIAQLLDEAARSDNGLRKYLHVTQSNVNFPSTDLEELTLLVEGANFYSNHVAEKGYLMQQIDCIRYKGAIIFNIFAKNKEGRYAHFVYSNNQSVVADQEVIYGSKEEAKLSKILLNFYWRRRPEAKFIRTERRSA